MRLLLLTSLLYSLCFSDSYYYNNGKKVAITSSNFRDLSNKVYIDENERKLILTDNIVFKVKEGVDLVKLQSEFDIKIIKKYSDTLFLAKAKDSIIDRANALFEDSRTIFAHPDFITEVNRRWKI